MVNTAQAYQGYKTTSQETASDKQIETKVFSSITSRMKAADPAKPGGFAELAEAMQDNVRLWGIIFGDVIDENNKLPKELKAQLINLAEFTRRHTLKVLAGEETVEPLIEVNQAIIAGLRGILPEAEAA